MIDRDEVDRYCAAASDAPWELSPVVKWEKEKELVLRRSGQPTLWLGAVRVPGEGEHATTCILTHDDIDSLVGDGTFIAAARTDLPLAVAELREQDRRIATLEAESAVLRRALELVVPAEWMVTVDWTTREDRETKLLKPVRDALDATPLTAAYQERVKALEKVAEAAKCVESWAHPGHPGAVEKAVRQDLRPALTALAALGEGEK